MTDLISREAALATVMHMSDAYERIYVLPAAQVKVKPLVWEPIDTAPKDGTRVILWRGPAESGKQSEMVIAEWHGGEWQWPDEAENPCTHGEWSEEDRQGGYYSDGRYFTHWMPLPAAPVDASQTPDPVINDPRVKALVEQVRALLVAADGESYAAYNAALEATDAALRAIGGEE